MWIVGYGDIGRRIARRLSAAGQPVQALSRSAAEGVSGQVLDLDAPPAHWPALSGTVFYTAPPPRDDGRDTRIETFLAEVERVETLVYLSTSGVYGDCQGAWVDETRPLAPRTERARRRVDAERQLTAWAEATGGRLVILRVPGIYGPGRLPRERLRRGAPVIDPAEAPWSNRIHADDLAAVSILAADHGRGVYNVSDGTPSKMSDYFLACARLLGLPEPPLIGWREAEQSYNEQMLSFLRESRRLDIRKARNELGYTPRYPTLEQGLPASLDADA